MNLLIIHEFLWLQAPVGEEERERKKEKKICVQLYGWVPIFRQSLEAAVAAGAGADWLAL